MTAALDALDRLDYGSPLPGDVEIAAIFDRHCQWEALRLDDRMREYEHMEWLARQCAGCEEGGRGDLCDLHGGGEGGSFR
ncbi:hypothetical protein FHR83_006642 [Actinoplanes campanulatus]|uniref:Uncharacterized protein n=1 Tax=Actinoplanes campanulatus TaxID=113559 RepID=A0A7W5FHS8_9ACTN|nr:hypothetical protein [Actinoplanes campanulatus]MBB3098936.1 hypothetical protein [Actinoplanes campanulatus]GGN39783.1 hypothetical protein GCM10010109_68140 [Actinoplanes campanulatus]GID40140.1 hypothetical protein Aca09nite_66460 [Actinoplanes campanulatus]